MLLSNLNLLATAPDGVAKLRELILTLAVQGKLVPQDASDEPASVLLKKIRAEKDRLVAEGKIKRDKPLVEIAEEEKPFELPTGWEWSSLATVGAINPRNDAADDTAASFVQMSSIPAAFSEAHISEERPWRDIKSGFTHFAEGDVGVAKITPCFENGKSTVFQKLSNGVGAGTTELHIVRPFCGLVPQYVLLFLKTPRFLQEGERGMTGSAGQKRLSRAYFENTPFPLPPLAEQSRIVTRVEELMRLCDALQAKARLEATQHAQLVATLLATLTASSTPEALTENWHRVATHFDLLLDRPEAVDALEQTILQLAVRGLLVPQDPQDEPASQLLKKIRAEKDKLIAEDKIRIDKPVAPITEGDAPFGLPSKWEWVRIDDIAEVQGGIQKTQLRRPVKEHHPYLRVANVQRDALLLGEIERFELTKEELARWRLIAGDLLIVEGNGSADEVGRCAVWSGAIDPCVYQNHLIRVRCVQSESMAFIKLFLNAPSGAAEMKRLAITTSGLYNLSVGKIRNFVVPVPPLGEQSRIVARVASLRALCADLRQRLTTARAQQALLAQALVQDVAHS